MSDPSLEAKRDYLKDNIEEYARKKNVQIRVHWYDIPQKIDMSKLVVERGDGKKKYEQDFDNLHDLLNQSDNYLEKLAEQIVNDIS